ncbi:MAG: putative amidophosphoribosyltransferase [Pedosphaera sp.]|nr:putative amidophosphoribosyltransferase [Pedosphaera sp.]
MTAALPFVKRWLNTGLGFLYPEVCQICRQEHATAPEGFVCAACWQQVRFIKAPFCERCGLPYAGDITTAFECHNCRDAVLHFRTARSAVTANKLMLEIIHRYKYNRQLWFEPFLADLLVRAATPVLAREQCDLLIPVPLHAAKRRERGFNQAERLAACLSRATRIPVNNHLLQRVKPTQTQTRLHRDERAKNVQHAFALRPGRQLHGEKVVLLDDVFTTGATTSACARVLLSAGASDVCVWTVARGL